MVRYTMLLATALLASPLLAQEPAQTNAQHMVDQTLATHPGVAVMAMHVTPPGQKDNIIFASNIGRIGKRADSGRSTNWHPGYSGDLGHFGVDVKGNRLFVNVADHSYVAVADKKTLKVIARWPINGAKTNLTMALDEADHRLFVGSRNPSKLFVLNTDTGATVALLDAPATSDGLFRDSARKRVYVPGGDGYPGVYQQPPDGNTCCNELGAGSVHPYDRQQLNFF